MRWVMLVVIASVIFVSAFLISRIKDKKKLEHWKNVTGILSSLVAAIALLWAAFTFFENSRVQKTVAAASIYQEHMKLSFANTELANGEFAPEVPQGPFPDKKTEQDAKNQYEKYQWYVGHALFSFETIFEALPDDKEWQETAAGFIIGHKKYIGSENFPCKRYSPAIQKFIYKVAGNCG